MITVKTEKNLFPKPRRFHLMKAGINGRGE
jgi:hypothetical protein